MATWSLVWSAVWLLPGALSDGAEEVTVNGAPVQLRSRGACKVRGRD
jgi:hypothetical protein